MKCKKCKTKFSYGTTTCPGCGRKINYKCRECGEKLSPTAKKCPACSAPTPLSSKYKSANQTKPVQKVSAPEFIRAFFEQNKVLCLAFAGAVIIIIAAVLIFSCGSDKEDAPMYTNDPVVTQSDTTTSATTTTTTAASDVTTTTTTTTTAANTGELYAGMQLEMPEAGEQVAVLETNYGTMKIHLFPEAAPKAVENFTTLILSGYYDGVTFHRVIKDFMIQGGDPQGTGMGGESCWGGSFEDEFSPAMLNISYSVAMANSGANTNGSQFFINQTTSVSPIDWAAVKQSCDETVNYFESQRAAYGDEVIEYSMNQYYTSFCDPALMSDAAKALYDTHGGNYFLDGAFNKINRGHTVFGQVYEGKEVVDAIAAVQTDSSDKPVSSVIINKAYIETYQG